LNVCGFGVCVRIGRGLSARVSAVVFGRAAAVALAAIKRHPLLLPPRRSQPMPPHDRPACICTCASRTLSIYMHGAPEDKRMLALTVGRAMAPFSWHARRCHEEAPPRAPAVATSYPAACWLHGRLLARKETR
jgi:hypothetical protein